MCPKQGAEYPLGWEMYQVILGYFIASCQRASRQWYPEDRRLDSAHWDKGMCLGSPVREQAGSAWADSRTHFTAQ